MYDENVRTEAGTFVIRESGEDPPRDASGMGARREGIGAADIHNSEEGAATSRLKRVGHDCRVDHEGGLVMAVDVELFHLRV